MHAERERKDFFLFFVAKQPEREFQCCYHHHGLGKLFQMHKRPLPFSQWGESALAGGVQRAQGTWELCLDMKSIVGDENPCFE